MMTSDALCDRLLGWFMESALPLWSARGLDRVRGGFHEALDHQTLKDTSDFKRLRVVTRQIYVFSAAARLGHPLAQEGLTHGLSFLMDHAPSAEGGFANRFNLDGQTTDPTRDLYDLAFAAFALAHAFDVMHDTAIRQQADALAGFIVDHMRHPSGGFAEALPDRQPRRQNPHMHFLEAALAWAELAPDGPYTAIATELAALFRDRLFDQSTGTLPEFFTDDLKPIDDGLGWTIEPGHHFEWVWLLHYAYRLGVLTAGTESAALYRFAKDHGIDPRTGLPWGEVAPDGTVLLAPTRLWSVTEWIKAEAVTPGPDRDARIARAWEALDGFLDTPTPGLWHERWDPVQDRFLPGPAPATSFYHIVMALETTLQVCGQHPRPFGTVGA